MQRGAGRQIPQAGFGLLELIVVIGVIAVLVTILSLSIRQIRASFAVRHAAEMAMGEARRAQGASIAAGVDYTVEFVLGNPGMIRVYADCSRDHQYTTTAVCAGATVDETVPVRTVSGQNWPSSVKIISGGTLPSCQAPLPSTSQCVTFGLLGAPMLMDGVTPTSGDVWLQSEIATAPADRVLRIVVQPATGRVSTP